MRATPRYGHSLSLTLLGLLSAGGQASLTEVVSLGQEGWQEEGHLGVARFGMASVTMPLAYLMCPDSK